MILSLIILSGCGKVTTPNNAIDEEMQRLRERIELLKGQSRDKIIAEIGPAQIETYVAELNQTIMIYRLEHSDAEIILNARNVLESYNIHIPQ